MARARPRKKLRKKDLKAPIAPARGLQRVWDFLETNYKQVLIGVGIFLVAGFAVVAIQSYLEGRRHDANTLLGRGLETEITPLVGEPDAPDPSKAPRIDGYEPVPVFPDADARARAALAKFAEVRDSYSGDDVAVVAKLAAAGIHYDLREWDNAIAVYQEFLADVEPSSPLRPLAREALGAAYEAKGDLVNAKIAYEALSPDGATDAPLADKRLFHLARLAAAEGNVAEARTLFEQVKTGFPASPLIVDINARLTLLDHPDLLPPFGETGAVPTPMTPVPAVPMPGTAMPAMGTTVPAPATGLPATGTPAPGTSE